MINLDETELARLEYLIEASESCGYSTKSDDPNMQYLAAAAGDALAVDADEWLGRLLGGDGRR